MLKAEYKKHTLVFKEPVGTSRGVLKTKDSWYLLVWDIKKPSIKGVGECSIIPNLSIDDSLEYENVLVDLCSNINRHQLYVPVLKKKWPSILFGLEMALADLQNGGKKLFYESSFTKGKDSILINGLIWMGNKAFMEKQVKEKLSIFNCLKMKIGAIDFEKELDILKSIRNLGGKNIDLRVDANGAFSFEDAKEKLERLSQFNIHSIEQPIKQGQWDKMAKLCKTTSVPIALDEELIGISDKGEKQKLLDTISPHYIILKPSLIGGIAESKEWISLAKQRNIGWWITSALEGNIGLNFIAQWTYSLGVNMPQGLGTGSLYINNVNSPLEVENGRLLFTNSDWGEV